MLRLYDGNGVTQQDLHRCAMEDFGKLSADYCRDIASLDDFDDFKRACAALGKQFTDTPGGLKYMPPRVPSTPMLNAALLMRYPFLAGMGAERRFGKHPDRVYVDDDGYGRFDSTLLDCVLDGWNMRFGLELCEDIRELFLTCADPETIMKMYLVEQVKEKYASLRWYDTPPVEISEQMHDLNMLYEALSERTCDTCGSWKDVRVDNGGYFSTVCLRCRRSAISDRNRDSDEYNERIREIASEHGCKDKYVYGDVRNAIIDKDVVETTSPVTTIADNANVRSYSNGEEHEYNAFERLCETNPELHIIRLVEECDKVIAASPTLTPERAGERITKAVVEDEKRMAEFRKNWH